MSVEQAISILTEMEADSSRTVKEQLQKIMQCLQTDGDMRTKVNKAQQILDELSADSRVQSSMKMQLFSVASILETL